MLEQVHVLGTGVITEPIDRSLPAAQALGPSHCPWLPLTCDSAHRLMTHLAVAESSLNLVRDGEEIRTPQGAREVKRLPAIIE